MKILLVVAVAATCLVLPAVPAFADVAPVRVTDESDVDTNISKFAEAECPEGQVVFGMGGRVNNGGGHVALTTIMPGPMLRSVVVQGRALPSASQPWSVTAVAVCHAPGPLEPERLASAPGQYLAQDTCPEGKVLYSTGFWIPDAGGDEFIRASFPSNDLRHVTVRADGPGVDPANLIAQGICAFPTIRYERTEAPPTAFDSTSPKDAVAGLPENAVDLGAWMFGAGAEVVGATGVLIDALFPTPNLKGAYGRAQKVSTTVGFALATTGDDWGLEVDGEVYGEWC
jgi:hypothetical protein